MNNLSTKKTKKVEGWGWLHIRKVWREVRRWFSSYKKLQAWALNLVNVGNLSSSSSFSFPIGNLIILFLCSKSICFFWVKFIPWKAARLKFRNVSSVTLHQECLKYLVRTISVSTKVQLFGSTFSMGSWICQYGVGLSKFKTFLVGYWIWVLFLSMLICSVFIFVSSFCFWVK